MHTHYQWKIPLWPLSTFGHSTALKPPSHNKKKPWKTLSIHQKRPVPHPMERSTGLQGVGRPSITMAQESTKKPSEVSPPTTQYITHREKLPNEGLQLTNQYTTYVDLGMVGLQKSCLRRNPPERARDSSDGLIRRMFGIMVLFAVAATVKMYPIIDNPGYFTVNSLKQMEYRDPTLTTLLTSSIH